MSTLKVSDDDLKFFSSLSYESEAPERVKTVEYFKAPQGTTQLRIVPRVGSPAFVVRKTHFFTKQTDGRNQVMTIECPTLHHEACPICEAGWAAWRANKENPSHELEELSKNLRPRESSYANVIVRGEDPTPKVWALSYSVRNELKAEEEAVSKRAENGNPVAVAYNPLTGYDIILRKERKGQSGRGAPDYMARLDRESSPLAATPALMKQIIEAAQDLSPEVFKPRLSRAEFEKKMATIPEFLPHVIVDRGAVRALPRSANKELPGNVEDELKSWADDSDIPF